MKITLKYIEAFLLLSIILGSSGIFISNYLTPNNERNHDLRFNDLLYTTHKPNTEEPTKPDFVRGELEKYRISLNLSHQMTLDIAEGNEYTIPRVLKQYDMDGDGDEEIIATYYYNIYLDKTSQQFTHQITYLYIFDVKQMRIATVAKIQIQQPDGVPFDVANAQITDIKFVRNETQVILYILGQIYVGGIESDGFIMKYTYQNTQFTYVSSASFGPLRDIVGYSYGFIQDWDEDGRDEMIIFYGEAEHDQKNYLGIIVYSLDSLNVEKHTNFRPRVMSDDSSICPTTVSPVNGSDGKYALISCSLSGGTYSGLALMKLSKSTISAGSFIRLTSSLGQKISKVIVEDFIPSIPGEEILTTSTVATDVTNIHLYSIWDKGLYDLIADSIPLSYDYLAAGEKFIIGGGIRSNTTTTDIYLKTFSRSGIYPMQDFRISDDTDLTLKNIIIGKFQGDTEMILVSAFRIYPGGIASLYLYSYTPLEA